MYIEAWGIRISATMPRWEASGEEPRPPHEACHVVHQAQGRVTPATQVHDGVPAAARKLGPSCRTVASTSIGTRGDAHRMGVLCVKVRREKLHAYEESRAKERRFSS